jgi:hypothetical protein
MHGWNNPYYLPILTIASGIGMGVGGLAGFGLGCFIEKIHKAGKKSQPTGCSLTSLKREAREQSRSKATRPG